MLTHRTLSILGLNNLSLTRNSMFFYLTFSTYVVITMLSSAYSKGPFYFQVNMLLIYYKWPFHAGNPQRIYFSNLSNNKRAALSKQCALYKVWLAYRKYLACLCFFAYGYYRFRKDDIHCLFYYSIFDVIILSPLGSIAPNTLIYQSEWFNVVL